MRAVQLLSHGTPGQFRLTELPDPQPAPDEVVVRVRACGLNRLDLWLEEGALPIRLDLPRVPGGEIAGEIAVLGSAVDPRQWKPGDRVAVQSNLFCGECEFCVAGDESLCLKAELLGVQRDGGFAEQVFQCLARGGTVVTCGATAGRQVQFNLWPFFVKQQKLIGSYGRTREDMRITLRWLAAGKLKPTIDRVFPLEQTPEAFAALRSRSVLGKLLVKPAPEGN